MLINVSHFQTNDWNWQNEQWKKAETLNAVSKNHLNKIDSVVLFVFSSSCSLQNVLRYYRFWAIQISDLFYHLPPGNMIRWIFTMTAWTGTYINVSVQAVIVGNQLNDSLVVKSSRNGQLDSACLIDFLQMSERCAVPWMSGEQELVYANLKKIPRLFLKRNHSINFIQSHS